MIKKLHKLTGYILPALLIVAMALPLVSSPAFAATAPTVTDDAVSNVTETAMRLNYTVTDTGGENPHVYVVWRQTGHFETSEKRDNDLPELLAYWENSEDCGVKAAGSYFVDIADLQPQAVYWKVIASNSGGVGYSDGQSDYPTMPVPTESFTYASNSQAHARAPNVYFAQTFTAIGNHDVYAVAVYSAGGSSYGDITVTLKEVDGASKPTGAALKTKTIPMADTFQGWNWFYFETPQAVVDATEYAIIVQSTYSGAWWHYFKIRKTDNLYADGVMWLTEDNGTSWSDYAGEVGADCDLWFKVYDADALRRSDIETFYPDASDLTETTATLSGVVSYIYDYDTDITFEWGTTDAYGSETAPATTLYTAHGTEGTLTTKGIDTLTAATEYHYRIKAVNTEGTSYGADVEFWTPDYSEEGTVAVEDASQFGALLANQRKSFYAQGRYWVFFADTSSGYLSFKSSTDGATWSTASVAVGEFTVEDYNDSQFCVTFDGVYLHLTTGRRDYKLAYKMGTPNSNGTITWNSAGTQEAIGEAIEGKLYTAPFITTDSDGYPWVFVGTCDVSDLNVQIFRSTTKNGTWTPAAGYPKELAWGTFWQRGIALPLDNGDMYFIAGRRGNALFVYNGAEQLKGMKYTASTDTFGAPDSITTTSMDYIGDANYDPFALFSAVSWGGDVYLVFTNSDGELKFQKYTSATDIWSSEETLATGLARRTAPALTVHDVDGKLYAFWIDGNYIYYKARSTAGVWDGTATVAKYENTIGNTANINTWEHSVEGKTAVTYRTTDTTEVGFIHGDAGGDYSIKFFTLSTGFSVGTDTPANVTTTGATLQGHLVDDGGEASSVRFQWGLTTAYGNETTWQSGMETGDTFSQAITGLSPNVVYHFRAQAKHADLSTVSGADLAFTTSSVGLPTIATGEAASVMETTATLQGTLTSLGDYSPVYVYFQYGLTTGYGNTTAEQTKTSTGGYNQAITGLITNTTYHYRAAIRYDGASYIYGDDATFTTTVAGLQPPTNFTATRGDTTVSLSWVKASGATNTLVRRSTTAYPTTTSSGVLVYNGIGISKTDTGLTNSQAYYYSAWSESDGVYSGTYATAYSGPAGTGAGILPAPDELYLCNVLVVESYQSQGDQLIVFQYNIGYASGDPSQNARDFFAFEVYDGATLVARAPVLAWGNKPGSVYLSPTNALVWGQAFTLKVVGLASQWDTIPQASIAVQDYDWTYDREDFKSQLRDWCVIIAGVIDTTWVTHSAAGDMLSDTACAIFNSTIPAISSRIPDLCSTTVGFVDIEPKSHTDETQRGLTTDNLGPQVNAILDSGADIFGMDSGASFGSILAIIILLGFAIGLGFLSHSTAFTLIGVTALSFVFLWGGLIALAWVMVIAGILVLYMLYKLVVGGV